jgi:endonuclease-3
MPPTRAELRWVHGRLVRRYGAREQRRRHRSVLDGLVATILSQNTTDANSSRAFESLKASFVDWDDVRRARTTAIERAIRSAGLGRTKARRIKAILSHVHEVRAKTSLEHLRRRSAAAVREELGELPGVGPKTIACVLLFDLGRSDFPVDTHVHRVSKRLGWVPGTLSAEATYSELAPIVPDKIAYALHVLLVQHGRATCRPREPQCDQCPLAPRCPMSATVPS